MINGINSEYNSTIFDTLNANIAKIKEGIESSDKAAIDQKNILVEAIANGDEKAQKAIIDVFASIENDKDITEAIAKLKDVIPPNAAIKETGFGTAVMAKGWEKPIVFPKEHKVLGFVDNPKDVTTKSLWEGAYGAEPVLILGAVGNSNIKPEQVKGGTSLTKSELSKKYEDGIKEFYNPIINYLEEQGAKKGDIGFAFAHSDSGVDRATREIAEDRELKGFGITPTRYTKYMRGKEMPACEEFPNGFILADFPFPSVLTRGISEVQDYAEVYGKMVGKDNPLGVFGGGEHSFKHDEKESIFGEAGSIPIPVDIMKDKYGIVIPAKNKNGIITNAAANTLENVNGNPYEQYKYAFNKFLPDSKSKSDLAQYDPQAAIATVAYAKLANEGKTK